MIKLLDLISEKKKKYIYQLSDQEFKKYTKIAKLRSQGKITQAKFDSELKKILK